VDARPRGEEIAMNETSSQTKTWDQLEQLITRTSLSDGARAFLLLRICQASQVLSDDLFTRFWPQLVELQKDLSGSHREAFDAVRTASEPPPAAQLGAFARGVVEEVDAARRAVEANREEALQRFASAEQKLRARWWPFGKAPAWTTLAQTWVRVDRAAGMHLLRRLEPPVARNLLVRLNDEAPLTPDEWELACQHAKAELTVRTAISEILDQEQCRAQLPSGLRQQLLDDLLGELLARGAKDDRDVSSRRDVARRRTVRLVAITLEDSPEQAVALLRGTFVRIFAAELESWTDRFSLLRDWIGLWAGAEKIAAAGLSFLREEAPAHLRDFCLAQWYGVSAGPDDLVAGEARLRKEAANPTLAVTWYLVTLVRRGMGAAALDVARASPLTGALMPNVWRALLCLEPTVGRGAFEEGEEPDKTAVSRFLAQPTTAKRVEYLRTETEGGRRSLPADLWARPSFELLFDQMLKKPTKHHGSLLVLFSRNVPQEQQLAEYVRIQGFGAHNHESVDPLLLETLVAWDDAHPEEVDRVLHAMWGVMCPSNEELRNDLFRGAIFERCRTVFAVRPTTLDELFIRWMKKTVVDQPLREQVGNTIYTLQLNEVAPFLQTLLAAEQVAPLSADRRDQLLEQALRYPANDGLLGAAARLYSDDKGVRALEPPSELRESASRTSWQVGVLQGLLPGLLQAALRNASEEPAAEA
jgi:hypothetical protein